VGLDLTLPVISLMLTLAAGALLWFFSRKHAEPHAVTPRDEFLFWQLVIVVLLLFGPLTWMMNLVWLLPSAVLLLGEVSILPRVAPRWSVIVLGTGLLIAALPEFDFFRAPDLWLQTKYVFAEIAVLAGLWGMGAVSGVKSLR
jgi:hypothetical protein